LLSPGFIAVHVPRESLTACAEVKDKNKRRPAIADVHREENDVCMVDPLDDVFT